MFSKYKINNAISFSGKTFALTNLFKNDLLNSQYPILLSLVGPARSGKSTYANMLLNPVLPNNNKNDIFKTDEGNVPVTNEIQYTKIKLSTLIRNHNLSIDIQSDPDIFILDCEGIDSLGEVTQSLRKAIFTLLQISTINIYVTKNLDRSNIYDLKAFFLLPKLIPGTQQKFKKANSIVLTDIGVPGMSEENNFGKFESERRKQDSNALNNFLSHLNERNIDFSKENTSFYVQPKWKDEKHYFESINDHIKFMVSSISKQVKIPGKALVEIFDKSIPIITQINELDNPDIRLEKVIKDLIVNYYQTAYDYSISKLSTEIKTKITNKNAEELINLSRSNYIAPIEKTTCKIFQQKSNEIFEGLIDLFPEKYKEYCGNIINHVQNTCTKEFENQCISKVIPYILNEVKKQSHDKIRLHFNQYNLDAIRTKDKTKEIASFQKKFNDELNKNIRSICPKIIISVEYHNQMNNLQITIANEVSDNFDRRMTDKNAVEQCRLSHDKYQNERKKYEQQIYRVCEARVPTSCGGEKSWVREGMEHERDDQGRYVYQLKQQYENDITNLDSRINQYKGTETSLANELINEKLNLLTQELNNRNDRIQRLDNEIQRAWQPVHSGGGFWKEDRMMLQGLQSDVKQEVENLQQLIMQTRNNMH